MKDLKVRYEMRGEIMDLIINELIKEVCSIDGVYIKYTDQMIRANIDPCYKIDRIVRVEDVLYSVDRIRNKIVKLVYYTCNKYGLLDNDNIDTVIMHDVYQPIIKYKDGEI